MYYIFPIGIYTCDEKKIIFTLIPPTFLMLIIYLLEYLEHQYSVKKANNMVIFLYKKWN